MGALQRLRQPSCVLIDGTLGGNRLRRLDLPANTVILTSGRLGVSQPAFQLGNAFLEVSLIHQQIMLRRNRRWGVYLLGTLAAICAAMLTAAGSVAVGLSARTSMTTLLRTVITR